MTGFRQFLLEMFIDQRNFFWATNAELEVDQEFIAGNHESRELDDDRKTVEAIYDRMRLQINPELPSRIGALFLSRTEKESREWMRIVNKKHLYEVMLLTGKPYLTDAERYTSSHHNIGKPIRYSTWNQDKIKDYYNNLSTGGKAGDEYESWRRNIEWDGKIYWNSGNQWHYEKGEEYSFDFDNDIELPEVVVAKGSKLKVIRKIN